MPTAAFVLFVSWFCLTARAQEPPETTMVGIDDAFSTGDGLSELQFAIVRAESLRGFGDAGVDLGPAGEPEYAGLVTFTRGLSASVDLTAAMFGVSYIESGSRTREFGTGDLVLAAKWRFRGDGESEGWHVAYRPGVSVPIGEDEGPDAPGLGFWTLDQALVATLVRRRWVIGIEGGYLLPVGDRGRQRGLGFVSAGAGFQASPRAKPEIELSYASDFVAAEADPSVLAATAGLIVNASRAIRIDIGLRYGLWGEQTAQRLTATANLSWSFGPP